MVAQEAAPGVLTYRMHSGARTAYIIAGVLLCILVIGIPFGIWMIVAASRARIEVRGDAVIARALTTTTIRFSEVRRLGYMNMPIYARGIGGALARKKVGGDHGVNLCAMDSRGRTLKFIASMYENYQDVFQRVSWATQKPVEELKQGMLSLKWPEAPAA